jgi:hypothetical protein
MAPLTFKKFPVKEEKVFTSCPRFAILPQYKTPAGNLAVLICADAWYPNNYTCLNGADIIAVPSLVAGKNVWDDKWNGYNGGPQPADVDKTDVGSLTESEAWKRYAMLSRGRAAGIKSGMNVFLRGDLWDVDMDGNTLYFSGDAAFEAKASPEKTGSLINVWLQ